MIWHQIQIAKREKKDLDVIFFDLANAFGSVPRSILWAAFDFFKIPECITNLVKAIIQDLWVNFIKPDFTTTWRHLEVGIMPLEFTMEMDVIIKVSKWVVGSKQPKFGVHLTPVKAYMDDITTLTTTASYTRYLVRKI